MAKIEKLTLEQKEYLPIFRQKCLDIACNGKRIERDKLQSALNDAYAIIEKEAPLLIILQSPQQAVMVISFMQEFAKGKIGECLELQLRSQLWSQLWLQLRSQLGSQLESQLESQYNRTNLWGSQDLFWIGFYKFCEEIGVEYTEEQRAVLDINYRIANQCEWWWPYEGICFVSEKPTEVNWDGDVLHGENKPAVLYEDGYSVYSWRGTNVPKEWITNPDSLTPEMAITWDNVEQRRCIAEILGWHNILSDKRLNARTINKDADPQIGELIEVDIPEVGTERFLKVVCGTDRDFALPVPPDMDTALDAQAWLNFCTTEDILQLEIRT